MQRISILIEKINDLLNDEKPKTTLELDLMLDYSRVMYAELLEWRKQIETSKSPITRQSFLPPIQEPTLAELTAAMNDEIDEEIEEVTSAYEPARSRQQFIAPAIVDDDNNSPANSSHFAPEHVINKKPTEAKEERQNDKRKFPIADWVQEEIQNAPMDTAMESLSINPSHFTPPTWDKAKTETSPETIASAIDLPIATVKENIEEDKEQELPKVINHPAPKPLPIITPKPEIRKHIGINEKYQFISELFGNDVAAYEAAMTEISMMEDRAEAEAWIQDNLLLTPIAEDSDGLHNFNMTLDSFFKQH